MKYRVKLMLLALSCGAVGLNVSTCFVRWLGDFVGDTLVLRSIA